MNNPELTEKQKAVLFGAFVRTHRIYARLRTAELARAAGIDERRLGSIEAGRTFNIKKSEVKRLAEKLGCDQDFVLRQACGEIYGSG